MEQSDSTVTMLGQSISEIVLQNETLSYVFLVPRYTQQAPTILREVSLSFLGNSSIMNT